MFRYEEKFVQEKVYAHVVVHHASIVVLIQTRFAGIKVFFS